MEEIITKMIEEIYTPTPSKIIVISELDGVVKNTLPPKKKTGRILYKIYLFCDNRVHSLYDNSDNCKVISIIDKLSINGNIVKFTESKIILNILNPIVNNRSYNNYEKILKEDTIKFQLAWNLIQ